MQKGKKAQIFFKKKKRKKEKSKRRCLPVSDDKYLWKVQMIGKMRIRVLWEEILTFRELGTSI